MYARSTTIRARTEAIDDGVAHIRDKVMPTVMEMDGCIGLSMLVDRQDGRCVVTTAWESREAMHASAKAADVLRDQVAERLGGDVTVDEWEIGALHRDHRAGASACARATWMRVDPARIDQLVAVFTESALPAVERLDGFCSASMMMDRDSGRCVVSVAYDSIESLGRNRERANEIRAAVLGDVGAELLDVGEFELTLAHLHVPELV
ncbi:antibiotic biosynthesis monooxygenase [Prauserella cavernicola]|uniref:Antibiotic biosynthesis monooxygenase n=1 Tax=Prauserella cavernicola TaxID=2800127 RepID=A0A934QN86_9PSEU|nr:antibiotic biosynthesis monooxygenase [Prauserella cavernicola]MBK1783590.1 antibiotic biosynthesis monooxygenase [Prauserella cavernicola]